MRTMPVMLDSQHGGDELPPAHSRICFCRGRRRRPYGELALPALETLLARGALRAICPAPRSSAGWPPRFASLPSTTAARAAEPARRRRSTRATPAGCARIPCISRSSATSCCSPTRAASSSPPARRGELAALERPLRRGRPRVHRARAAALVRARRATSRASARRPPPRRRTAYRAPPARRAMTARAGAASSTKRRCCCTTIPCNEAREARGELPVNSVWFWGAGRLPESRRLRPTARSGASHPLAAGLAAVARTCVAAAAAIGRATPGSRHRQHGRAAAALLVLDGLRARACRRPGRRGAARCSELEARWFAPLLDALQARRALGADAACAGTASAWPHRHGDALRSAQVLAREAARCATMPPDACMSRTSCHHRAQRPAAMRRRDSLASGVHPLLARVYAARGVTAPREVEQRFRAPRSARSHAQPAATMARAAGRRDRRAQAPADRRRLRRRRRDRLRGRACGRCARSAPTSSTSCRTASSTATGSRRRSCGSPTPGRGPDILITVDNGIASFEGVAEANRLGMTVLITDHHLPGGDAAGRGVHRQPQPARLRLSEQAPGRRRRHVLPDARAARRAAAARLVRPSSLDPGTQRAEPRRAAAPRRARHRRRRRARSTATTASWCTRDCSASARAACSRASPRCSRRPAGIPRARPPTTWGSWSGRG